MDKLSSSIYRYLSVEMNFDVKTPDKEKGIIYFLPKGIGSAPVKSWCEILKMPAGGYKVRLTIPSLSVGSMRTYLNGISDKLKKDYGG